MLRRFAAAAPRQERHGEETAGMIRKGMEWQARQGPAGRGRPPEPRGVEDRGVAGGDGRGVRAEERSGG